MPDDSTAWIGVLVAAGGLAFGLYQYRMNSFNAAQALDRERAIKAADELEKLLADQDVKLALHIIDYEAVDVAIPDPLSGATLTTTKIDRNILRLALQHHSDRATPQTKFNVEKGEMFSPLELQIRRIFDNFLFRLERIETLIRKGVIAKSDFQNLFAYWIELIGEIPGEKDEIDHFGDGRRAAFWAYIRRYKFNGVVRLFQMFGRAAPVGTSYEKAFVPRRNSRQGKGGDSEVRASTRNQR